MCQDRGEMNLSTAAIRLLWARSPGLAVDQVLSGCGIREGAKALLVASVLEPACPCDGGEAEPFNIKALLRVKPGTLADGTSRAVKILAGLGWSKEDIETCLAAKIGRGQRLALKSAISGLINDGVLSPSLEWSLRKAVDRSFRSKA
jgi:hypothetical protein